MVLRWESGKGVVSIPSTVAWLHYNFVSRTTYLRRGVFSIYYSLIASERLFHLMYSVLTLWLLAEHLSERRRPPTSTLMHFPLQSLLIFTLQQIWRPGLAIPSVFESTMVAPFIALSENILSSFKVQRASSEDFKSKDRHENWHISSNDPRLNSIHNCAPPPCSHALSPWASNLLVASTKLSHYAGSTTRFLLTVSLRNAFMSTSTR